MMLSSAIDAVEGLPCSEAISLSMILSAIMESSSALDCWKLSSSMTSYSIVSDSSLASLRPLLELCRSLRPLPMRVPFNFLELDPELDVNLLVSSSMIDSSLGRESEKS